MMHASRAVPLLALLLALAGSPARATQMEHLDTRALVLGSNDIVVAEVESVEPRWNAARTRIYTDVRVRVKQALKGGAGETLTLTQLGGEVGPVRYTVPGCPVFKPGEESLLFVWRDTRGTAQVNGLAQGKFDIRREPGGVATVQRSVPGLAIRDPRRLELVPRGQAAPRIPLNDLLREVQRVLTEEAGR
jgi:hypothetical protein